VERSSGRIDVWWSKTWTGHQRTSQGPVLPLLLSYLIFLLSLHPIFVAVPTCVTYSAVPAFFPAAAAAGKGKEEERMESVAAAAKPLLKDEAIFSRRVLLEPLLLLLASIRVAVARRLDMYVMEAEEEGEEGDEARKACAGVKTSATRTRRKRKSGAWQLALLTVLVLHLALLVSLVNMVLARARGMGGGLRGGPNAMLVAADALPCLAGLAACVGYKKRAGSVRACGCVCAWWLWAWDYCACGASAGSPKFLAFLQPQRIKNIRQ